MSFIFYDIERSFCEYFNTNLSKGTGEVLTFEFPTTELGSHTYSVEFISDTTKIAGMGRVIDGGSSGRYIDTLCQIDIFRLPTSNGEPDVAGVKKMQSRLSNVFKGTHFIPFKTYGSAPTAITAGTTNGAIQINEAESSKETYDPNPNIRRYSSTLRLRTKEVF